MAAMDQSEVETSLRVRMGSPAEADVSAQLITEAVTAALKEYGKYRGREEVWTATSVKDQSQYTLPSACAMVLEAWWNLGAAFTDPFNAEQALIQSMQIGLDGGQPSLESPSLFQRFYMQLESMRQRFDGRFDMQPGPTGGAPELHLEPPTDSDGGTVYVLYRKTVTYAQILAVDEEPFMEACLWKACEFRALKLSAVSSLNYSGGGAQTGADRLFKMAADFKARFTARMPPMPVVVR